MPPLLTLVENQLSWVEEMTHYHLEEATTARHNEVVLNDLIVATEVYSFNSHEIFRDLRTLRLYINATLHLAPLTAPPPMGSLEAMVSRHLATEAHNADTRRASLDLRAHHSATRHHHEMALHHLELHGAVLQALRAELLLRN